MGVLAAATPSIESKDQRFESRKRRQLVQAQLSSKQGFKSFLFLKISPKMALLGASGVKIGLHNVSSKICVYMDCAYYKKEF